MSYYNKQTPSFPPKITILACNNTVAQPLEVGRMHGLRCTWEVRKLSRQDPTFDKYQPLVGKTGRTSGLLLLQVCTLDKRRPLDAMIHKPSGIVLL